MKSKGGKVANSSSGITGKSQLSKQGIKSSGGAGGGGSSGNDLASITHEPRTGLDSTSQSQVHFAVNTKLPPVASSIPSTPAVGMSGSLLDHTNHLESERQREKQLEAEIMGEGNRATGSHNQQKSQAIEKNLNQMIKVLNSRLNALDQAAKTRLHLLEEDLKPLSNKMSDQAPKIVDEFDEAIPKSLKENKSSMNTLTLMNTSSNVLTGGTASGGIGHMKDNLVSNDQVYIDPYHLVVRTKPVTEAGKKLESSIEESFGTTNLRELKHKNKKTLNQSEKSKRTEQLKNEAKRMNRLRIEKKLQLNMENFVTRSVMDTEFIFQLPDPGQNEVVWPVSVKWPARDPASARLENMDGEFDPDLLLRYALERINLPSGIKLFSWLVKQVMIQHYFVALFWIIKVKFFDNNEHLGSALPTGAPPTANTTTNNNTNNNSNNNNNNNNNGDHHQTLAISAYPFFTNNSNIEDRELYLLRLLSSEYRGIVELLANRSHAEHEKDFVYKFLPFILTNAVYYGFYYTFPGSRHLYTKGFKKTIYMQIIKIMHGFQVCPISVKVSWAKLFPEDVHDDNDNEGEDGGEVFPVKLAIKSSPLHKYRASRANSPKFGNRPNSSPGFSSPSRFSMTEATTTSEEYDPNRTISNESGHSHSHSHSHSQPHLPHTHSAHQPSQGKGGVLSTGEDEQQPHHEGGALLKNTSIRSIESQHSSHHPSEGSHLSSANYSYNHNPPPFHPNPQNTNTNMHSNHLHSQHLSHPSTAIASSKPTTASSTTSMFTNHNALLQNPLMMLPLSKTYLQPLLTKPSNIRTQIKRQNNVERLNAQEISPQMTLFLASLSSTSINKEGKDIEIDAQHSKQTFRRTIPVQWCPAGGSDTHQKRTVATDSHNEFAVKLKQSQQEYLHQTYHFHKEKISAVRDNQKTLEKILTSGPTNISRLSLDLIRRQRALRGNKDNKNGANTETPPTHIEELDLVAIAALANYDDEEIERFLAEL